MVGEDHRTVRGEYGVELAIGQAVGVLGVRLETHQVDDVDDPYGQIRQELSQELHGGQGLERRDVPAAGHHHIGLDPASLDANDQMPKPRVQWSSASSMVSQSCWGCLPATMTLT